MPAKVADASLLGAVVFDETRATEARSLLAGADLYEPALLAYELASIARKKIGSSPDQRKALLLALEESLNMEIYWVDIFHPAVVELALETGLTTYDASYLYLAKDLGVPLVTFDRKLSAFAPS